MKYKILNLLLSQYPTLDERKRYADGIGEDFWSVANDEMFLLDERDYILYPLVRIGSQVWMAENLRYNCPGSYVNPNAPVEYGCFYSWETAKKIAPKGFHLPTDGEWNTLEMELGLSASDANLSGQYRGNHGTGMKSFTGWNNGGNGDNSSGFNVFPTGHYNYGSCYYSGVNATFWSASEYSPPHGWGHRLTYGLAGVYRSYYNKSLGLSCRYVKDRNDE
jgi:uncharacterized protein (TIGR02145 family)